MAGTLPFICDSVPVSEGRPSGRWMLGSRGKWASTARRQEQRPSGEVRRTEPVFPKPPEVDETALELGTEDASICWKP